MLIAESMKQIIQRSWCLGPHLGFVLSGYRPVWWCLALGAFGAGIQLGKHRKRWSFCITIGHRVFGRSFTAICK